MKDVDIKKQSRIDVKPGSDLKLTYTFDEDRTGATVTLHYEERNWRYSTATYDEITPGDIDASSGISGKDWEHTLSASQIEKWEGRTIRMQMIVEDNGRTGVYEDFTITPSFGT